MVALNRSSLTDSILAYIEANYSGPSPLVYPNQAFNRIDQAVNGRYIQLIVDIGVTQSASIGSSGDNRTEGLVKAIAGINVGFDQKGLFEDLDNIATLFPKGTAVSTAAGNARFLNPVQLSDVVPEDDWLHVMIGCPFFIYTT